MKAKPSLEENIAIKGTKKFTRENETVHRSLKDVLKERRLLAEKEGETFTTKHFRAVSLFEDGAESECVGLTDDWKKTR